MLFEAFIIIVISERCKLCQFFLQVYHLILTKMAANNYYYD